MKKKPKKARQLPSLTINDIAQGNADFIEGLLKIDNGDGLVSIEVASYLFRKGILHGYQIGREAKAKGE